MLNDELMGARKVIEGQRNSEGQRHERQPDQGVVAVRLVGDEAADTSEGNQSRLHRVQAQHLQEPLPKPLHVMSEFRFHGFRLLSDTLAHDLVYHHSGCHRHIERTDLSPLR